MNQKDLERAFSNPPDKWTESQRRIVHHIEWLEKSLANTQERLSLFQKAAADKWLTENLTND